MLDKAFVTKTSTSIQSLNELNADTFIFLGLKCNLENVLHMHTVVLAFAHGCAL